ncbi:hypothetical protein PTET_a1778 [Pseudoalteromonas tetraodonis]|nr:hypothetical protein PTET_a1778 [Pseudoalteromonas tetraodonis]
MYLSKLTIGNYVTYKHGILALLFAHYLFIVICSTLLNIKTL